MTGTFRMNHWPNVRDKPGFLNRLMHQFADAGRMSLEGDLSKCNFADHLVIGREEFDLLKRHTLWPRQDFVILRLEFEMINPIFKQIMAAGLSRAIVHVQIEHDGILELGAYDNFEHRCVFTGPGVSPALLTEMKANGILRNFEEVVVKSGQ